MRDPSLTPDPAPDEERRVNHALRLLVDEMLRQLRNAAQADSWTPEERARAEADLQRIMESVRHRAFDGERSTTTD